MHLFKVHKDTDLLDALVKTAKSGRVPLLVRTPRCALDKEQVLKRVMNCLAIEESEHQEVDLKMMFYQAYGQPPQVKQEQRGLITTKVKSAMTG